VLVNGQPTTPTAFLHYDAFSRPGLTLSGCRLMVKQTLNTAVLVVTICVDSSQLHIALRIIG